MNKLLFSVHGFFARMKVARLFGQSFRCRDKGDLSSAINYLEEIVEIRLKFHDELSYQLATEELFNHYLEQGKTAKAIDRGLLSLQALQSAKDCNLSFYEKINKSKMHFLAQLYSTLSREQPGHPAADLLKSIIQKYGENRN
jgi:hypothetical protein